MSHKKIKYKCLRIAIFFIAATVFLSFKTVCQAQLNTPNEELLSIIENSSPTSLQKIKQLVEQGADVNLKASEGQTILHEACFTQDEELVAFLIKSKVHL